MGCPGRPCSFAPKTPPSRNRDNPRSAVTMPNRMSAAQPGKCKRRLFASSNAASSATLSFAKAKRWAAFLNPLRMAGC